MTSGQAWAIKDWQARFEVSQTARFARDNPRFVPVPVNLTGEHFRILMADRDGQAAFGVFIALVELAATMPIKGVLANFDGPLSLRAMSVKTGVPISDLEPAITFLSAPEISWLQPIQPRALRKMLVREHSERTRRALGADSELARARAAAAAELENENEKEQQHAPRARGEISIGVGSAAAAAPAACREVRGILSRLWRNGTADELAGHPNATHARVAFLADRIMREKIRRPHGFMRKGICEGWPIPEDWLDRWRRAIGAAPSTPPTTPQETHQ